MFKDTRVETARLHTMVMHTATIAEQMDIFNLTGKRFQSVKQPAVSDNLPALSDNLNNCLIDFDHFDIFGFDANKFRLIIKESLFIKGDQSQLNKTIK